MRTAGIALLAAWVMTALFDGRAGARERLRQAAVRGGVALLPIMWRPALGDTTWNLERLRREASHFTHHDLDIRDG